VGRTKLFWTVVKQNPDLTSIDFEEIAKIREETRQKTIEKLKEHHKGKDVSKVELGAVRDFYDKVTFWYPEDDPEAEPPVTFGTPEDDPEAVPPALVKPVPPPLPWKPVTSPLP
jgi:hypothetical protein